MVDKKGLKAINRNGLLIIFLVLGLVGFAFAAGLASMDSASVSPVTRGNYSGNIFLNCSTNVTSSVEKYNATFFYNASGGAAYLNATYGNLTGTLWNETATDNAFNITINPVTLLGGLADGRTYNISCLVNNGSDQATASVVNATIDNTSPRVNFTGTTTDLVDGGSYKTSDITGLLNINVSVADAIFPVFAHSGGDVFMNLTNSTGQVNFTELANLTSPFYNMTINLSSATAYPDGKYNLTIWANDSIYLKNSAGTVTANLNNSEYIQITLDRVVPSSVGLTRGTGTTRTQNVITIAAEDAAPSSGIDNCIVRSGGSKAFTAGSTTITGTGTATQTLTHTGLNCGTSYSYIVTCDDNAGNSKVSDSTPFSTSSCSDSSGGDTTTVSSTVETNVLDISPEVEATLSGFEEDMGIEEIKISVTEVADDVQIVVTKFDTEPAEITVSKTGNVHKYLQITSENLADKMSQAIITIRVQRNWLLNNEIDKANIALFRFDEVAEEWDELPTVYSGEDDTYYYYDVQVTSFSYFAIAEKVIGEPGADEEANLLWLWIVIGIVVVAAIIGGGVATKKKKK